MDVKFSDLDSMIVFAKNNEDELVFAEDVKNGYVCRCYSFDINKIVFVSATNITNGTFTTQLLIHGSN